MAGIQKRIALSPPTFSKATEMISGVFMSVSPSPVHNVKIVVTLVLKSLKKHLKNSCKFK